MVYNRINNEGKVISDKNDRYRNEAVCKKLKDKIKQQKLRGKDKTKYQVYDAVKGALSKSTNWNDFEKLLKEKGVVLSFKYKSNDPNVIQGISFTKGEVTCKGSEVDRKFSYSKINAQLQENRQSQGQRESIANIDKSQSKDQGASLIGSLIDGVGSLSTPEIHGEDYEDERFRQEAEYKQKKINKKNNKRPKL